MTLCATRTSEFGTPPPVDRYHVEVQVDGAMRKQGSQALRSVA